MPKKLSRKNITKNQYNNKRFLCISEMVEFIIFILILLAFKNLLCFFKRKKSTHKSGNKKKQKYLVRVIYILPLYIPTFFYAYTCTHRLGFYFLFFNGIVLYVQLARFTQCI